MQMDEDFKVTLGAVLTGFWRELKKANRLKALEIYLSTNRKMDAETRKAVEKKIEEIMKSEIQPFRVGLGAKRDLQARTD